MASPTSIAEIDLRPILKHQLVISSRARRRAPNLNSFDRFLLGLGSLFVPGPHLPASQENQHLDRADFLAGFAATQRFGNWSLDANVLYVFAGKGAQDTNLGDRGSMANACSRIGKSLAGAMSYNTAHLPDHAAWPLRRGDRMMQRRDFLNSGD